MFHVKPEYRWLLPARGPFWHVNLHKMRFDSSFLRTIGMSPGMETPVSPRMPTERNGRLRMPRLYRRATAGTFTLWISLCVSPLPVVDNGVDKSLRCTGPLATPVPSDPLLRKLPR